MNFVVGCHFDNIPIICMPRFLVLLLLFFDRSLFYYLFVSREDGVMNC